jgi:hypothetical protein
LKKKIVAPPAKFGTPYRERRLQLWLASPFLVKSVDRGEKLVHFRRIDQKTE